MESDSSVHQHDVEGLLVVDSIATIIVKSSNAVAMRIIEAFISDDFRIFEVYFLIIAELSGN